MEKLMKMIGWKTYRGKWDMYEMSVDLVMFVVVSLGVYTLYWVYTV